MGTGARRLVHTPFVPSGYWSPCAPLVWNQGFLTSLGGLSVSTNPVKTLDISFSSSQFCKQHPRHEKAVSRTSLVEAVYASPCESVSRERASPPHSRPSHRRPTIVVFLDIRAAFDSLDRTVLWDSIEGC
ncbi:unnamed protein product, partial [Schistosoma rodhaini]